MRVLSLNTSYKPNFGYSPKANKKLRYTLAQDPDVSQEGTIPNGILRLSELCNGIEDRIILQEGGGRKPGIQYTIPELSDMLISTKISLTRLICTHYPKLDYLEKEIEDYVRGGNIASLKGVSESENWRREMAKELDSPSGNYVNLVGSSTASSKDVANKKLSKQAMERAASLIEEFVPTPSSPDGFNDIKGMYDLKNQLTEMVVEPVKDSDLAKMDLEEYSITYPHGILLFGPPGCGKTYVTQALAKEAGLKMYNFKMSKAGSKFIHETANNSELLFDYVEQKAKEAGKPCILFIDEFESIGKDRDDDAKRFDIEESDTFLNLIQTAGDRGIIIVAATNKFDLLDDAIKRRFDEKVYVGLPDDETRKMILLKTLSKSTKAQTLMSSDKDIDAIMKALSGFSNDDICKISVKVARKARHDNRREITAQDYFDIINTPEVQAYKIKEEKYKPAEQKRQIGFGNP